ncbi:MAG: hypothetical protein AMS21_11660 [Gemmatimonas sp. SG8_38_2]|nr:MAG: hypothetical protein AMS21_11660 [Gemmatimonas sp. SG8_38_2]
MIYSPKQAALARYRYALNVAAVFLAGLALNACTGPDTTGPEKPRDDSTPPPPAAQLAFTSQPTNANAGETIAPAVRVEVQNASGNLITAATHTVSLTIGTNTGGGALSGTTEMSAVSGVATFDDISIDLPGAGYTLVASVTGLAGADSDPFDIIVPTLTPEARLQVLDEVGAFLRSLPDLGTTAENQALLAYLTALTDIGAVGISPDQTVWAEFADGLPVIFTDSRRANNSQPAAVPQAVDTDGRTARVNSAVAQGIPNADKAYVISAIPGNQAVPLLTGWLSASGYSIVGGGVLPGTVADFRNISDAGVLYVNAHGGQFTRAGTFVLATSDSATASETGTQEWQDYEDGLIILNYDKRNGYGTWVITAQFVDKYWAFATNAFVFIDGCTSFGYGSLPTDFKNTVLAKGAAAYLGWSGSVGEWFASEAAAYFFDRVLGANDFVPESPPQRPFSFNKVMIWLGENGLDFYTDPGDGATAFLRLDETHAASGILVPTIKRLVMDEASEELTVEGKFGPESADGRKVTLGGQPAFVQSWSEDRIVLKLRAEQDAFADTVVVSVRDHKSNAVPLTGWKGDFTYTVDADQIWAPGLTQEVKCRLDFRTDVHAYRENPGEAPTESKARFNYVARSSTCSFEMTGTGTNDSGDEMSLSGKGDLQWWDGIDPQNPTNHLLFAGHGDVDVAARTVRFVQLLFYASGSLAIDGVPNKTLLLLDPLALSGVECPSGPPPGFILPADAASTTGFDIREDSRSGDGPCQVSNIPARLTWKSITAISPPTPDMRR